MHGSSISEVLDELEVVLCEPDAKGACLAEGLKRLSSLPWGVGEAQRVGRIALSVAGSQALDGSGRGNALVLAARANRLQARFGDANDLLKKARIAFGSTNDRLGIANCDLGVGAIQAETGKPSAALGSYRRAQRAFQQCDDPKGVAACIYCRGLIHIQRTELAEALECYRLAERIYTELDLTHQATVCRLNIGNVHHVSGRFQEALETFVEARDSFDALGDRDRSATCRMNAGNAFSGSGRHRQAILMHQEAQAVFQSIGDERMVAACMVNVAAAATKLGLIEEAEGNLRSALDIFRRIEDFTGMGECYLLLAELSEPKSNGLQALQCFTRTGDKLQIAAANIILAKRSANDESEHHWNQALSALEKALSTKSGPALKHVVAEKFHEVGPALITSALSRNDLDGAARVANRSDFVSRRDPGKQPPVHIRFLCDRNVLHALVQVGDRLEAVSTSASREHLRSLVTNLRSSLSQPETDAVALRQELYRLLIRPVAPHLPSDTTLNISPGHLLDPVPFESLIAEDGRCLIEQFPLAFGPNHVGASQPDGSFLVLTRSEFEGDLPRLPAVGKEADFIRSLATEVVWLHQEKATVSAVTKRLGSAELIHIATHAIDNPRNPLASALILEPDENHPSGYLYARDIARLKLTARLVVLSACETASSCQSLARAFLDAGAEAVLASSWRAHDEAAQTWMQAFYSNYFASGDPSDGHRSACMHMIGSNHPDSHYWALWNLQC